MVQEVQTDRQTFSPVVQSDMMAEPSKPGWPRDLTV